MNALPRWRRPARLAGGAALTFGLAGTLALSLAGPALAGSRPANAQIWLPRPLQYAAVAWGDGGCGQLGSGTTTGSALPVGVSGLGGGVVQVAAGECHSLAVTSDGTVWAWGNNDYGQLGNGTMNGSTVPVQVTGIPGISQMLTGVTQVAAGADHSLALRSDGTVWAWGNDAYGQLGNGITAYDVVAPIQVTGLTGVIKIAAGPEYSLALKSDGTVWAWGLGDVGQLGNGTTTDSYVPVQVSGLSQVTDISAGTSSSLATSTNGITGVSQVWAWGANDLGQLGDGTLTNHLTPEPVTGINAPSIAGISAGDNFAVVLGTDGSVWGWGADEYGQLGTASASSPVTSPVQIAGPGSGITQVSAGGFHVLALESNGTVVAWGLGDLGQLGDGTTTDSQMAVQVSGLTNVTQLSAGLSYSLAVHGVPLLFHL